MSEPRRDRPSNLSNDVRRLLRKRLLRGSCSAEGVAGLLAMHRRTLSRHLNGEGTGFREIANEVRFEIACRLLGDTDFSSAQIASALGYSEPSAFTRAFRRWSGQTPSAWRVEHRSVAATRNDGKSRQEIVPNSQAQHPA